MEQTDASIVMDATVTPDRAALQSAEFERLARPCYERVFRFVVRQVGPTAEAEDVTQIAFVRAYRGFSGYDPERPFIPWIYQIARCAIADHYRRRRQPAEVLPETLADASPGPLDQADQSDGHDALWVLARRLKPKLHQVLLLYYAESFALAEVAQAMGVTQTHAKVLLFRARLALKKLLETKEGKEIVR